MEQASSSLFQLIAETQAKSIHLFGGKDGPGDHFRGKCFATKYSPVKVCDRHLFLFSFDWFFFWFLHSLLHGLHKCTQVSNPPDLYVVEITFALSVQKITKGWL